MAFVKRTSNDWFWILQDTLKFVKIHNCSHKHWFDFTHWMMLKQCTTLCYKPLELWFKKLHTFWWIVTKLPPLILNWLNVHVYVTENWEKIPTLFNLQRLEIVTTSNNLTSVIFTYLVDYGGLSNEMQVQIN
jgi:hypothetical protein